MPRKTTTGGPARATGSLGYDEEAYRHPSHVELAGKIPHDDLEEMLRLGTRLIHIQDEQKRLELERSGSSDKTKSWYEGPPVAGAVAELGTLFAQYGLKGIRIGDYNVTSKDGVAETVSKTKLAELGVDPDVIQQAVVRTPWFSIECRKAAAKKHRR